MGFYWNVCFPYQQSIWSLCVLIRDYCLFLPAFLPSPDLTYLFALEVSVCNHFLAYLLLSLCHWSFSVALLLVVLCFLLLMYLLDNRIKHGFHWALEMLYLNQIENFVRSYIHLGRLVSYFEPYLQKWAAKIISSFFMRITLSGK